MKLTKGRKGWKGWRPKNEEERKNDHGVTLRRRLEIHYGRCRRLEDLQKGIGEAAKCFEASTSGERARSSRERDLEEGGHLRTSCVEESASESARAARRKFVAELGLAPKRRMKYGQPLKRLWIGRFSKD